MVTAVGGEDLVASSVQACHANCIFGCFGSTVGKEHHVQITRRTFGNQAGCFAARIVCMERRNGAQTLGLLLNGRNQFRMLMSDIDIDELTREVEVLLARLIPEVAALGLSDNDRADQALSRPRVEHMCAIALKCVGGIGVQR